MALDNPHDKFFRATFSRKDVLSALIEGRFPETLRNRLDTSTLELTNASFVDAELSEYYADLVFDCRYLGEQSAKIVLLLEHKSYQEDFPHLQLLRYLLNLWEEDRKQRQQLTPVIPIVVYHGQGRWKYAPLSSYFTVADDVLKEFMPEFRYLLYDLSAWPDEDILAFQNQFLALATLLLKHSRAKNFLNLLQTNLTQMIGLLAEEGERNFIESVFVYVFRMENSLTEEQILRIFRNISPQTESIAMSAYDKTIERGKELAQIETIKILLNKGLNIDFIAEAVNWPVQKAEELVLKIKQGQI